MQEVRLIVDPAVSTAVDQQCMSPDVIVGQYDRSLAEKAGHEYKHSKNSSTD
jgi:hypothetical protein